MKLFDPLSFYRRQNRTINVAALVACVVLCSFVGTHYIHNSHAASPPLPGDLNGDGTVNALDMSILLSHWGQQGGGIKGDINSDGTVNTLDLSILLSHFGSSGGAGTACSGVTKDSSGGILFSRLSVSSQGHIMEPSGCTVQLVGLNEGNFFTGNANAGTAYIAERYAFLKGSIHQNIDRINFQARWWDQNVVVPDANMNFRPWLQQYIAMAEKAGNYVQLDIGPQYFEPPCGKGVSLCPSQNQGSKDYQADPACANFSRTCPEAAGLAGGDESIPLAAITDLGRLYANDPAVLMDVWNEPLDSNPLNLSPAEYFKDMNARIDTLRSVAPQMPVVVYSYQIMNLMATGQVPAYKQSNLVIDMHDYNPNLQPTDLLRQIQYFQSQGWGAILNEFGGTVASQTALASIASLAAQTDMGAVYFEAGNLYDALNKTPPPYSLNASGNLTQQYFSQILPNVFE